MTAMVVNPPLADFQLTHSRARSFGTRFLHELELKQGIKPRASGGGDDYTAKQRPRAIRARVPRAIYGKAPLSWQPPAITTFLRAGKTCTHLYILREVKDSVRQTGKRVPEAVNEET